MKIRLPAQKHKHNGARYRWRMLWEKCFKRYLASYNIIYNLIQWSSSNCWKRAWITSSLRFGKVGLKMLGKLRQTNKSWGSYGCAIVSKKYLDRQVERKTKNKICRDIHTLPVELSLRLQWDIPCPCPITWLFQKKKLTQKHIKSLLKRTKHCSRHWEKSKFSK